MKLSDCCGREPWSNGDVSTDDFGICPECKEHCEYIEYCDDCGEEECICDEQKEIEWNMIPNQGEEDERSVARKAKSR